MSRDTRNVGLAFTLSLVLVSSAASLPYFLGFAR